MLALKSCATTDDNMSAVYEVIHNDPDYSHLTLTQNFQVQICKNTGAITGQLNITDLKAPSMTEGIEKLAIWCERMAMALREPMKVKAMVPVFEKDWDVIHAQEEEGLGLSFIRLKKLALEKGISGKDTMSAAMNLYENGYISYPKTESVHLPCVQRDSLCSTLETITAYLRDLAPLPVVDHCAPIFNDDLVLTHWSIVPLPRVEHLPGELATRDKNHNGLPDASRTEQIIYRIVAEEYVRALCGKRS